MSEITLLSDYCLDTTVLSNIYIDEYMASNNEAQIKIYLFLLRNLSSGRGVSVSAIADFFNYTVQDVERSLYYMQKQGLMKLEESQDMQGRIAGIRILPLTKKEVIVFKAKPEYSQSQLQEFTENPEIMDLLFVAEQYIGKPLGNEDVKQLFYIKNELGFSTELIEYLMEYCVEQKKKSFNYMAKVAKNWSDSNVVTVEDAKKHTLDCPKEILNVFNAFGIKGTNRKPQPKEISFVRTWLREYGFTIDIIEKACVRTVEKTHSVSFEYADAVLKDWKANGIKSLADIEKLDAEFLRTKVKKDSKGTISSVNGTSAENTRKVKSNKFNDYAQRQYDFDELERKLLEN